VTCTSRFQKQGSPPLQASAFLYPFSFSIARCISYSLETIAARFQGQFSLPMHSRHAFLLFLAVLMCAACASAEVDARLQCATCKTFVDEVHRGILETKETHTVQVRFRIDEKIHIPYARSEYRLLEIMDSLCDGAMKDYGVSGHESADAKRLVSTKNLKGAVSNLSMGGHISSQIVRLCHRLKDEHEEEILQVFHRSKEQPHHRVCVDISQSCSAEAMQRQFELQRQAEADAKRQTELEEEEAKQSPPSPTEESAAVATNQTESSAVTSSGSEPASPESASLDTAAAAASQSLDSASNPSATEREL